LAPEEELGFINLNAEPLR